ncbi:MAG: hypothetical protein ACSLE0_14405 [Chitinophagaceae bacterium]
MKKGIQTAAVIMFIALQLQAQNENSSGHWKTWFIKSAKEYRLPAPSSYKKGLNAVVLRQQHLDSADIQQILYWNAGAPGYRWVDMMSGLWMTDTTGRGALANMLLSVCIYDATLAAWETKYAHNRARPFIADKRIKSFFLKPGSPSYPCEYSVTAGVAATIISHFFPSMADSVNKLAALLMDSRIAAGYAFPDDTKDGFELGKRIASYEIKYTKDFVPQKSWDGKMPQQPGLWKGKPMLPLAGFSKTVVLDSSSQFRPGPPPDFAKDMAELKNFKPTFRSTANAFYWASQDFWSEALNKKIFEYNIHLDPPRAARLYAITAIGYYDGFVSCWDAKYAYWGTRPDQYDTTYHPILFYSPPFPGYPSGHAMIGSVMAGLYSYFFPAEKTYFQKKAKEGAESRFQGGIHFRTDNDIALEMGAKVADAIIKKVKKDGADENKDKLVGKATR